MPLKMEIIISKYTIISPVAPMPKNSASEVSSMEKSKSSKIPINCRLFVLENIVTFENMQSYKTIKPSNLVGKHAIVD